MFICLEGIDGAGKSTQARMLTQRLCAEGRETELVADPGTTQIGTAIRQILLHNDAPISTAAQMLLFSAARAELANHIMSRLQQNVNIICDRWLLSTLVYQGEINNINPDFIEQIFRETSFIQPDICFLLDISAEAAGKRMGKPGDRYERRCAADKERMRYAYLRYAHERPNAKNVRIVLADQPPEETHEQIYGFVKTMYQSGEIKHGCSSQRTCSSEKVTA